MKSLKEHISQVKDLHSFNEYIDEQFNPEWDYVVEMASIGYPVLNKTNHYILQLMEQRLEIGNGHMFTFILVMIKDLFLNLILK